MIATMLLTSQLFNFTICVLLAIYKRHPIVLWALLGAVLPVTAPLVIALAPRLESQRSSVPASPMIGWLLLSAGALAAPQTLVGVGFSVNSSQVKTSVLLLLLSVGAMAAGATILRKRSFVNRSMPTPAEHLLHGISAAACLISNGYNVWADLIALPKWGRAGLNPIWHSLLPVVVAVYLLQGRRFARPLLIALSLYALAPGAALMMGPFGRTPFAWGDTRSVLETCARVVALTALIVAALLEYWRRRSSRDSAGIAFESAT